MPSIDALESTDDQRLDAELRLARVRSQFAVVRTITDQVERLERPRDADGLRAQLVEETARLWCSLVDAVGALIERTPSEESGVFVRPLPPCSKRSVP